MDAPHTELDPKDATARVVDGALALIRAEVSLFATYAKEVGQRAGVSLAFGWVAVGMAQLALVLIVLSPLLVGLRPWHLVVIPIALALVFAAIAAVAAARTFRAAKQVVEPEPSAPQHLSALERIRS